MTFKDSAELLSFHWVAYTIYALIIISVIAWFGYNLTRKEKVKSIVKIPFYGYIAFLVAGGVGHHIFTYNTIPWVSQDINREHIKADKEYHFYVKDHKWIGIPKKITLQCGETVRFRVDSKDLVYGFGLFRADDGTMAMQMQINPGTDVNNIFKPNDILWTFNRNGVYNLTSTEYSGPAQYDENGKDKMLVKDFLEVVGCDEEGGKV